MSKRIPKRFHRISLRGSTHIAIATTVKLQEFRVHHKSDKHFLNSVFFVNQILAPLPGKERYFFYLLIGYFSFSILCTGANHRKLKIAEYQQRLWSLPKKAEHLALPPSHANAAFAALLWLYSGVGHPSSLHGDWITLL